MEFTEEQFDLTGSKLEELVLGINDLPSMHSFIVEREHKRTNGRYICPDNHKDVAFWRYVALKQYNQQYNPEYGFLFERREIPDEFKHVLKGLE